MSPPSTVPESNRAQVKSKTSVERVPNASQSGPVVEETPASQPMENKETEERITDEQPMSSGSETDREDDWSHNEEVLSRFPARGASSFHWFTLPFVASYLNDNRLLEYFIRLCLISAAHHFDAPNITMLVFCNFNSHLR